MGTVEKIISSIVSFYYCYLVRGKGYDLFALRSTCGNMGTGEGIDAMHIDHVFE